jgi:glyoxylase-like metal-dependent hydrolase (beta-lactamase superfamily II)
MKQWLAVGFGVIAVATLPGARAAADAMTAPAAQEVARGVWMIPGGIPPGRQPDGNSVAFETPVGWVVVDTGRHRWHREAIASLAHARAKPIVAIVNTHWHLDHVSGNPELRVAYPGLRVYASDAIDGALGGFLAASARDAAGYLADPQIPESMREDIRADVHTIEQGAALKPDVVIERSGAMTIGGRAFHVHLARQAVTAGDVWLYDEAARLAVLGDLVTLPVPFLDTACPAGWLDALREVVAVPFEVAVPGHGMPMTRAEVDRYRLVLDAFIACARSERPAVDCSALWADGVESLLAGVAAEKLRARRLAEYYVGVLRANGGRSPYCETLPAAQQP